MNNKDIPSGFQLHVTTWENDADNYKTAILSGLTDEDVKFYISLAKEFESRNNRFNKGLGNGSLNPDVFEPILKKKLEEFPLLSSKIRTEWEAAIDYRSFWDKLVETILEMPDEGMMVAHRNFVRVYSHHRVYYIPAPIRDVTDDF